MSDIVERLRAERDERTAAVGRLMMEIALLRAALQEIADMRYSNTSAATIARRALELNP